MVSFERLFLRVVVYLLLRTNVVCESSLVCTRTLRPNRPFRVEGRIEKTSLPSWIDSTLLLGLIVSVPKRTWVRTRPRQAGERSPKKLLNLPHWCPITLSGHLPPCVPVDLQETRTGSGTRRVTPGVGGNPLCLQCPRFTFMVKRNPGQPWSAVVEFEPFCVQVKENKTSVLNLHCRGFGYTRLFLE